MDRVSLFRRWVELLLWLLFIHPYTSFHIKNQFSAARLFITLKGVTISEDAFNFSGRKENFLCDYALDVVRAHENRYSRTQLTTAFVIGFD